MCEKRTKRKQKSAHLVDSDQEVERKLLKGQIESQNLCQKVHK